MKPARILVTEYHAAVRTLMAQVLEEAGYQNVKVIAMSGHSADKLQTVSFSNRSRPL